MWDGISGMAYWHIYMNILSVNPTHAQEGSQGDELSSNKAHVIV